jgi:alpha-glucosidase
VKRGSIIPEIPVQQYIGEKKNIPVWFNVFPAVEGHNADFTLYEDDGETHDYKKDIFGKTKMKYISANDFVNFTVVTKDERGWSPNKNRNFGIKIHLDKAPKYVSIDSIKFRQTGPDKTDKITKSKAAAWSWDKLTGICKITWQENVSTTTVTVKR